jgi:hypothetical protein
VRALIFKQLREQALLALFVAAVAWALSGGMTMEIATAFQRGSGSVRIASFWLVVGLVLGVDALERDRRSAAREYLAHRGLSARQQCAARLIASSIYVAFAGALAAARFFAESSDLHPDALAFDPVSTLASAALAACSSIWGLAIGSLVAAFVRTRWRLVLVLVPVGRGAWMVLASWQSWAGERIAPNEWTWILWNVGASACVFALAAQAHLRGHDLSRALQGRVRSAGGLAVLALTWLTLHGLVTVLADVELQASVTRQPFIVARDGRLKLVDALGSGAYTSEQLVFRVVGGSPPSVNFAEQYGLIQRIRPTGFEFGTSQVDLELRPRAGFALERGAELFVPKLQFDLRAWCVVARHERFDPRYQADSKLARLPLPLELDPSARVQLVRPDGRAFSRTLERVALPHSRGSMLLTDSGDCTLWTVGFESHKPRLMKHELPDGDSWTGWTGSEVQDYQSDSKFGPGPRLRGRHGWYEWTGASFTRRAAGAPSTTPVGFTMQLLDNDVLAPHVVVIDDKSGERLEHRYEAPLHSAALLFGAMALRSPLASVAQFLSTDDFAQGARASHSVLSGGRRPWLLAFNAAVSLIAGGWLARRGALGLSRAWWAVALAFGPLAAVVAAVIEPRYPPPREAPARRPKVRIVGLDAPGRRTRVST